MCRFEREDLDERDSIDLNREEMAYPGCGCLKLAEWDPHPMCHEHMGIHHAEGLAAHITVPYCYYCEKLLLHQRYQWLSYRASATRANVVDDHDASQRATDQVGGSGLGAWGFNEQQAWLANVVVLISWLITLG